MNKIQILKKVRKAIESQMGMQFCRKGICGILYGKIFRGYRSEKFRSLRMELNEEILKNIPPESLFMYPLTDAGDRKRIKFIDRLIKKYEQEDKPRKAVKKPVNVGARTRRASSKVRKARA